MTVMNCTVIAVLAVLIPAVVHAQDRPKVGLTAGYPSAIGVILNLTDGVALRPEISLSHVSGDSGGGSVLGTPSPSSVSDGTGVGVGLSALFYLHGKDSFRPYLSPKFSYARTSTSSSTPSIDTFSGPSTSEGTSSAYTASGSFGAEYSINRRFAVFGELGASYSRSTNSSTSTFTILATSIVNGRITQTEQSQLVTSSGHSNTVGTRTAVGVIVYF
jgi:hypothetical protein